MHQSTRTARTVRTYTHVYTCTWMTSCSKEGEQEHEHEPGEQPVPATGGKSASKAWPWCGAEVKGEMVSAVGTAAAEVGVWLQGTCSGACARAGPGLELANTCLPCVRVSKRVLPGASACVDPFFSAMSRAVGVWGMAGCAMCGAAVCPACGADRDSARVDECGVCGISTVSDARASASLRPSADPPPPCRRSVGTIKPGAKANRHDQDAYTHQSTAATAAQSRREREATSHLHQGENQFFGGANAIERGPGRQLGLATNGQQLVVVSPRTQGRVSISKVAPGLGARRQAARSQPLGLVSSRPPFSSPAPVWHGRGAGVRERAGTGLSRRAWCRCLSACRPRAVEIVVRTRRT